MIKFIKTRARAIYRAALGDFDNSTKYLTRTPYPVTIARKTSTKEVNNFDPELAHVCKHFGIKQREYKGMNKGVKDVLLRCRASQDNRRRAMRKANSIMVLFRVWQWNEGRCYLCEKKKPFNQITADHVFPKALGFQLSGNSMPACSPCNNKKQDRIPTPDEVQKSIAAYVAIGKNFDPITSKT